MFLSQDVDDNNRWKLFFNLRGMYMTSSNGALMSWHQKGNALVKEINLIITGSNVITILFSISHIYIKKLIKNCKNYVGAI